MLQSFPLALENIEFRTHHIVDIYPLEDKIAFIHLAFSSNVQVQGYTEPRPSSYVLLDTFSSDFAEHRQAYLSYIGPETFSPNEVKCYWEDGSFILNTKYYPGLTPWLGPSIAKIIKVSDTELVELRNAPPPDKHIYETGAIYHFTTYDIFMASDFIMVCQEQTTRQILWKLRLTAYLYTEVEECNGILYFGTAGKGGRFYAVCAADGRIIFSYNTGGTVRYSWYKNSILLADRKRKPILLNPDDGTEVKKIDFGSFQFTFEHFMLVKGDRLYAVAYNADEMYAVCADFAD